MSKNHVYFIVPLSPRKNGRSSWLITAIRIKFTRIIFFQINKPPSPRSCWRNLWTVPRCLLWINTWSEWNRRKSKSSFFFCFECSVNAVLPSCESWSLLILQAPPLYLNYLNWRFLCFLITIKLFKASHKKVRVNT